MKPCTAKKRSKKSFLRVVASLQHAMVIYFFWLSCWKRTQTLTCSRRFSNEIAVWMDECTVIPLNNLSQDANIVFALVARHVTKRCRGLRFVPSGIANSESLAKFVWRDFYYSGHPFLRQFPLLIPRPFLISILLRSGWHASPLCAKLLRANYWDRSEYKQNKTKQWTLH